MYNFSRQYVFFFLAAISVILTACKKEFLEVEPKGAIVAQDTKDYESLLNTARISASSAISFLGDEVAAQNDYFSGADVYRQRLFEYSNSALLPDQLPELGYLTQNYVFNKIIEEVTQSKGGTEGQKLQIMAEAKAGRALCHLLFVNEFGKPYNEATAKTDLGVPIIIAADVTKNSYKRATVQEVYDFIIKNLNEAIPNLTKPFAHTGKMSKAAAEAILARTYFYMHKYEQAKVHLDNSFAALSDATRTPALYDYNETLGPDGTWLPAAPDAFGPQLMPLASINEDMESIYNVSINSFNINSANTFVTTPHTGALYGVNDFRLQIYSSRELFGEVVFPDGMRRYPRFEAEVGVSLPDMYLMRAELRARMNDLAGAKSDLELLRGKRMPEDEVEVPSVIAASQQNLVIFILQERIREFALKGMRWYDMRRLSTDPVEAYRNSVSYSHKIYDAEGNTVETLTFAPKNLVLKFGKKLLAQHPQLVEND
ncbi:SusD family protein [Pedobacter terrae]|uniref:SusD family protein n=1 Tax=Pedobacter terrae TaxID=405671 RepID=A0A1G8BT83_9SPHI|nr:RagB/SusD family nutrient uptake outer membrane protein [Pedobacter terrae]SDH36308.1 SusD family protein [Pedobacter terrae]